MRHHLLVLFGFLCVCCLRAATFSSPQWIHYPEPDADGIGKPRYFWKDFVVKERPSRARVYFVVDDSGEGFLGKNPLQQRLNPYQVTLNPDYRLLLPHLVVGLPVRGYDLTNQLRIGSNRFVIKGINAGGPGGVICRLHLVYNDGSEENIVSDLSWKVAKTDPYELAKDPAALEADTPVSPLSHGDATIEPWGSRVDLTLFLSEEKAEELKSRLHFGDKSFWETLHNKLASEKKPVTRVFYDRGKAMLDIDGKPFPPIFYATHYHDNFTDPLFTKNVAGFRDADLHLYVMGTTLEKLWPSPNQFSFEVFDAIARQLLAIDPDARLIFTICASQAPKWWMDKHPWELVQYASTEEPTGPRARDVQFSKWRAPSYASKVWQQDFNAVIDAFVQHVEASPYAKRVIGYRLDSGVYLEWHHYGFNGQMPDTSRPMTERFREWLHTVYASDNDLQNAWNDTAVTLDTAEVPGEALRLHQGAGSLRDPVQDRATVDYLRCLANTIADFMLAGDGTIKKASDRRALVGNFCGYFFEMVFQSEGWHQANDRILASDDVDFQSHPTCYGQVVRDFGEGQPARSLVSSYRLRGKLSITEADTRTHWCTDQPGHTFCATARDDINALARDFSQSLCRGNGFWYFDFAFNWYISPEVQEYLKKLVPIWKLPADNNTASEVLLIGDWDAPYYAGTERPRPPHLLHLFQLMREMPHTGVPFDTVALKDLENPELSDYKVYVFLNMLCDKPEARAFAQKMRTAGKTIVWLDRAGFLTEQGADAQGTERLTTFQTETLEEMVIPELKLTSNGEVIQSMYAVTEIGPTLKITDADAEILGTQKDVPVYAHKVSENGGSEYLATVSLLPRAEWRRIFRKAGVFCYNDDDDAVIYANRSFVMLHLAKGGERTVHFPQEGHMKQLLPEMQDLGVLKDYTFTAEDRTTYLFYREE